MSIVGMEQLPDSSESSSSDGRVQLAGPHGPLDGHTARDGGRSVLVGLVVGLLATAVLYFAVSTVLDNGEVVEEPSYESQGREFVSDSLRSTMPICQTDQMGDGICDERNNIPSCRFDMGDCCCVLPPCDAKADATCKDPVYNDEADRNTYSHGAVSTTHDLATRAALQVLEDGGNAVDAAVTAQFVLNVVQPESTGIGGGCFILVHDPKTEEIHAIDGREETPANFHENAFCADQSCGDGCVCESAIPFTPQRVTGGHPVGVPGTLAATHRLLKEHGSGKFSLGDLMKPAITLAREGFPMHAHLHERIHDNVHRLKHFEASRELFLDPSGTLPKVRVGEVWRNPDLAATFELIAEEGLEAFYNGTIAEAIVSAVKGAVNPDTGLSGLMELEDLARYRAVKRRPTRHSYRGKYDIWGFPPPSSGGHTIGLIFNLLEAVDFFPALEPGSSRAAMHFIDAQNTAFADRNKYIGDTDFVDVPWDGLLDKEYASTRAKEFFSMFESVDTPIAPGTPPGTSDSARRLAIGPDLPRSGTTHLSVGDSSGLLVSWTTTIEENLGSAVVVPGHGFLLNNELTDFNALARDKVTGEKVANAPDNEIRRRRSAIGEGDDQTWGTKRPRSSMSPTIVMKDGKPFLATGSPGGSTIIGIVSNFLMNKLSFDMDLRNATDADRIIARNGPVILEPKLHNDEIFVAALEEIGIEVDKRTEGRVRGYVQSVMYNDDGTLSASADNRRNINAFQMGD